MSAPKFTPVKSIVDISFFSRVSDHKLNDAKLSEDAVPLSAVVTIPVHSGRAPAVSVEGTGFNSQSCTTGEGEYSIPGQLVLYNNINRFKQVSKEELLQERGASLIAHIEDQTALERPELLMEFAVYAFADLKRHKYWYWFMFPVVKWQFTIGDILPSSLETVQAVHRSNPQFGSAMVLRKTGELVVLPLSSMQPGDEFAIIDFGCKENELPWYFSNFAALLSYNNFANAKVHLISDHPKIASTSIKSRCVDLQLSHNDLHTATFTGWEQTPNGKFAPKEADLSALISPLELASQAVDLNLQLMKWRAAPALDLEVLKSSKCLLIGAGTLGGYVSRALVAWGVRNVDFIDSGSVSYSNPVRQPLFTGSDAQNAAPKAETAAQALKQIFHGVESTGYNLAVPMVGHPVSALSEAATAAEQNYELLYSLIKSHDAIFLLTDSRESRWLPALLGQIEQKLVLTVAIGFDSWLAMRHGVTAKTGFGPTSLGCYFCSDVVAPSDSQKRATLDQMCTVTRPGVAQIASGSAVEIFAAVMQSDAKAETEADTETILGPATHQLRGFLARREQVALRAPAFMQCSACGRGVQEAFNDPVTGGWEFVRRAVSETDYLTSVSGLEQLQAAVEDLNVSESEGDEEGEDAV